MAIVYRVAMWGRNSAGPLVDLQTPIGASGYSYNTATNLIFERPDQAGGTDCELTGITPYYYVYTVEVFGQWQLHHQQYVQPRF